MFTFLKGYRVALVGHFVHCTFCDHFNVRFSLARSLIRSFFIGTAPDSHSHLQNYGHCSMKS